MKKTTKAIMYLTLMSFLRINTLSLYADDYQEAMPEFQYYNQAGYYQSAPISYDYNQPDYYQNTPYIPQAIQNPEFCQQNSCDGKFVISADCLYAKVTLENTKIATAFQQTSGEKLVSHQSPTLYLNLKGRDVIPKPGFSPGYRVRFVYEMPNKWFFECGVGGIRGKASNRVAAPRIVMNAADYPLFNALASNPLSTLKTHFTLDYFLVTADVGRIFEPIKKIFFLPYFGVSYLSTKENFRYAGELISSTGISPLNGSTPNLTAAEANIHGNLKFRATGAGVNVGSWAYWNICEGFYLWGRVVASARYTYVHTNGSLIVNQVNRTNTLRGRQNFDDKGSFITGIPTVDTLLGLIYAYPYEDKIFAVRLAWEQIIQISNGRNAPVQGVSIGGSIEF